MKMTDIAPKGKLIQNDHLQVAWSANAPPKRGPTTDENEKMAPMNPRYLPRSRISSMSDKIINTIAINPPAPTPATPLKVIKNGI